MRVDVLRGLVLSAPQLFRASENPHRHDDIAILWVTLDAE